MRVRSLEKAVSFCYSFKFMHSSDLFLFGAKELFQIHGLLIEIEYLLVLIW